MTYVPSGNPATGSEGLSALMRAEFASISTAFTLLPRITTTGIFDTTFAQVGSFTFTLPNVAGTLATTANIAAEATTRATADTTEKNARIAADALLAPRADPTFTGDINTNGSIGAVGVIHTSGDINTAGSVHATGNISTIANINVAGTVDVSLAISCHTNINASGTVGATSFNTTSDQRLKYDQGLIENSGAIIDSLTPRWFAWRDSPDLGPQPGFFAQEVYESFPWAVSVGVGEPGEADFQPWRIDVDKLMPLVIAEIKALRARVAVLEGDAV